MKTHLIVWQNKEHCQETGRAEISFDTEFTVIPIIGDYIEYVSKDNKDYYGEVVKRETFKNDATNEETLYITMKEFGNYVGIC